MIGASRADLQHALLMVDSELRLSNQRKSEIISAIELQANRDDATHATLCRFLLGLISKTKIHALIKTIRPIRANTSKKNPLRSSSSLMQRRAEHAMKEALMQHKLRLMQEALMQMIVDCNSLFILHLLLINKSYRLCRINSEDNSEND
jgi:hypothetical protein